MQNEEEFYTSYLVSSNTSLLCGTKAGSHSASVDLLACNQINAGTLIYLFTTTETDFLRTGGRPVWSRLRIRYFL